jgi:hypothetical protein
MHHPRGEGGGLSAVEALRFAFVVEAVGAVGSEHGVLVVRTGRRRWLEPAGAGRGVVAGVEQLVTDVGGPGEGRG